MRKVIGKYCVERKETQTLRCALTPEELQETGRALADTQIERAVLDAQKKDFMNQWKARSDELSAKQNRIAESIRTCSEYRRVDCRVVENYELGIVQVTRLDTEHLIESRPMNADANQRKLLLFDADGEEKEIHPVEEEGE